MNVLSLNRKRGKKETFPYGDDSLSITELLKKPEVVNFVERDDGPLTYASQREKLRKLLRNGRINQQLVMDYAAQNPPTMQVQDNRYGAQRRRANLPMRTRDGRVLFGPEPPPRLRRPVGTIVINGDRLTARQALERYPQLYEHFKRKESSRKSPYMQSYEESLRREIWIT